MTKESDVVIQPPMVRIELVHMKQSILAALGNYNGDIAKHVSGELQKAIDTFDFEKAVREVAEKAIHEAVCTAIKNYFAWGEGRDAINSVVKEALLKVEVLQSKPEEPPE